MEYDFFSRWGIKVDDEVKVEELTVRISISLSQANILDYWHQSKFRRELSIAHGRRIELPDRAVFGDLHGDLMVSDDDFRDTLLAERIESIKKIPDLARLVESILNAATIIDQEKTKRDLKKLSAELLRESIVCVFNTYGYTPFSIQYLNGRYITLPKFSSFHLSKIAEGVFANLSSHPDAMDQVFKSVKSLLEDGDIRAGLDASRLGLEKFLKSRLAN